MHIAPQSTSAGALRAGACSTSMKPSVQVRVKQRLLRARAPHHAQNIEQIKRRRMHGTTLICIMQGSGTHRRLERTASHCTCRIVLTTSANCLTKSSNTARCTRKRSMPAQFCPQLWKHARNAVGMTCRHEPISANSSVSVHALCCSPPWSRDEDDSSTTVKHQVAS